MPLPNARSWPVAERVPSGDGDGGEVSGGFTVQLVDPFEHGATGYRRTSPFAWRNLVYADDIQKSRAS